MSESGHTPGIMLKNTNIERKNCETNSTHHERLLRIKKLLFSLIVHLIWPLHFPSWDICVPKVYGGCSIKVKLSKTGIHTETKRRLMHGVRAEILRSLCVCRTAAERFSAAALWGSSEMFCAAAASCWWRNCRATFLLNRETPSKKLNAVYERWLILKKPFILLSMLVIPPPAWRELPPWITWTKPVMTPFRWTFIYFRLYPRCLFSSNVCVFHQQSRGGHSFSGSRGLSSSTVDLYTGNWGGCRGRGSNNYTTRQTTTATQRSRQMMLQLVSSLPSFKTSSPWKCSWFQRCLGDAKASWKVPHLCRSSHFPFIFLP